MKLAFRVDASQAIGTGHLRRCLALAHALRDLGADVRFVMRDLGLDATPLVDEAGFQCLMLVKPGSEPVVSGIAHADWAGVSEAVDAADTVAALAGWHPAWVIVDHYAFAADWHAAVRSGLECRIAAIDDLADRALDIDLLIDHNYDADHRTKYAGRIRAGASVLGGSRFALLAAAFADAPRYVPHDEVRSIGIFMGGVDHDNVSSLALKAIAEAGFEGEVEIVATSANPNLDALRAAAADRPGTVLTIDLPDLAAFFARHDLQIGAGGGASWERCCIGVPTLLLLLAENQRAVVPALAAEGVAVTPMPLGTLDAAAIAEAIGALIADPGRRCDLSERSRALVDGLGAHRVALRLLADRVAVRPATLDDAGIMHRWRNDPATRRVSRTSQEIEWGDHLAWTGRVLADPERELMIGTVGDRPVGVIRFDRLDGGRAEVSLYLDPALHGLGLGKAMLLAGERAAAEGLDILAEVLEGNDGSARLFDSAGYRRVDASHWIKPAAGRTRAN